MRREINQGTFVSDVSKGVRDFSGCDFIGNIDVNFIKADQDTNSIWIFDRSSIKGELFISDITARSASFVDITGDGNISLSRPSIDVIYGSGLRCKYFSVITGKVVTIDLTRAVLSNRLMIKKTPLERLSLRNLSSPETLINESSITQLVTRGAYLGRRSTIKLGEKTKQSA